MSISGLLTGLLGVFGVVIGAIVAWWLPYRSLRKQRAKDVEQDIITYTILCYNRISKMRLSTKEIGKNGSTYENEKSLLGGDSNKYIYALSKKPNVTESDFVIIKWMNEILTSSVEGSIQEHLKKLEDALLKNIQRDVY
jgi:hypothetical protein